MWPKTTSKNKVTVQAFAAPWHHHLPDDAMDQ